MGRLMFGGSVRISPPPHPGEQLAEIPVRDVLGNILYPRLYIYEYLVIDNPPTQDCGDRQFLWSSPREIYLLIVISAASA